MHQWLNYMEEKKKLHSDWPDPLQWLRARRGGATRSLRVLSEAVLQFDWLNSEQKSNTFFFIIFAHTHIYIYFIPSLFIYLLLLNFGKFFTAHCSMHNHRLHSAKSVGLCVSPFFLICGTDCLLFLFVKLH